MPKNRETVDSSVEISLPLGDPRVLECMERLQAHASYVDGFALAAGATRIRYRCFLDREDIAAKIIAACKADQSEIELHPSAKKLMNRDVIEDIPMRFKVGAMMQSLRLKAEAKKLLAELDEGEVSDVKEDGLTEEFDQMIAKINQAYLLLLESALYMQIFNYQFKLGPLRKDDFALEVAGRVEFPEHLKEYVDGDFGRIFNGLWSKMFDQVIASKKK